MNSTTTTAKSSSKLTMKTIVIAVLAVIAWHLWSQHETTVEARQLYDFYKRINPDKSDYNEDEFVRGKLISRCDVNGKPRGYYGWFEFRTVLLEGERVKNDTPTRLYIFALTSDEHVSAIWRGQEEKQVVIDNMHQTCN